MEVQFQKYHGCGNDFLILDELERELVREEHRGKLGQIVINRYFGFGSTSMLYLTDPRTSDADVRMRIFESDQSESNMCGNGIRCIADYVLSNSKKDTISIETGSETSTPSIKKIKKHPNNTYAVNMGQLTITEEDINQGIKLIQFLKIGLAGPLEDIPLKQLSKEIHYTDKFSLYGTGEPHLVIFTEEDLYKQDNTKKLFEIGKAFNSQQSPLRKQLTPSGCNINLVQVINNSEISVRTYERGVNDESLACGTGATACAARAYLSGRAKSNTIKVNVKGSNHDKNNFLTITVNNTKNNVSLTMAGPAEHIGTLIPSPALYKKIEFCLK